MTQIKHAINEEYKSEVFLMDCMEGMKQFEDNYFDLAVVDPLVPYLADLYALDDNVPNERQRGIKNDIAVLKSGLINEVWLYGDKISTGMQEEIKLAKELNIPIKAMSKETKILFKPK